MTSTLLPTQVVTFGETMAMIKTDTPGPLAHTQGLSLGIGGSESNFAIALSRLGATVSWISKLGADSFGDLVQREITAEGVQTVTTRDASAPTGLMIKERRTGDSVRVWYYRAGSAASKLTPADLPEGLIEGASLLHLSGITPALSPSAAETVDAAIERARSAGIGVSLDLNYRAGLWSKEQAAPVLRSLASRVDIVFAGAEEAKIIVEPGTPAELARRIVDLGPTQAVIKLGSDGAVALVDGVEFEQAAVKVHAVDTVGAGDGFVAGYLAEFLAGLGPAERLATGVRVGAFACLTPGDWEGLPRRAELGLLDATEPVSR